MKRWRVVHFPSPAEAEAYLNGLSIEPDQIRGLFPAASPSGRGSGVVLVCWLTAHQQRIEQLRRAPRSDEDLPAPRASTELDPPLLGEDTPKEPPAGRRRQRDEDLP
ncbi:MAG TPA: hypothetical protein VKZ60_15490 [Chloroflexota bacterium]|jgi:hypothetical protein|nr:hypothetical protein [Chloroflexota bacterium]